MVLVALVLLLTVLSVSSLYVVVVVVVCRGGNVMKTTTKYCIFCPVLFWFGLVYLEAVYKSFVAFKNIKF